MPENLPIWQIMRSVGYSTIQQLSSNAISIWCLMYKLLSNKNMRWWHVRDLFEHLKRVHAYAPKEASNAEW